MHSTDRIRLLLGVTALATMPFLFGAKGGCGGQISIGVEDSGPAPGSDSGTTPTDSGPTPTPCPDGYMRDSTGNCCKPGAGGGPGECIGWVDAGPGVDGGTITCTPEMCGPMPKSPSYTCPDGSTGGNTGKCLPTAEGKCGWEHRECPPTAGCSTNAECAKDSYCNDSLCGKSAGPKPAGTCAKRPEGCPLLYAPVCGCDNKTHGNSCSAAGAGVSVQYEGECKTIHNCGGIAGIECAKSDYCHYETKEFCGGDDGMGVCKSRPEACPEIWSPVCGCDGRTHGNECDAHQQGTSIAYLGECKK